MDIMTLTTNDLRLVKDVMKITIDEELDVKLDEKIGKLPTKDEFYKKMDEVIGELKTIREEQPLQAHQLAGHEDRIVKIEESLQFS
jgi:hypothetical protein